MFSHAREMAAAQLFAGASPLSLKVTRSDLPAAALITRLRRGAWPDWGPPRKTRRARSRLLDRRSPA